MAISDIIEALTGEQFTQEQRATAEQLAVLEVKAYTGRAELDAELEAIAAQIAVIKLNRLGSEGAAALAYSGVNESYVDGYPANIVRILNKKRLLVVL